MIISRVLINYSFIDAKATADMITSINNSENNKLSAFYLNKRVISLCLFLIAILIRIYQAYKGGIGFFPDSTQYLSMASNLIDHNNLESFGAMFPDIMRPILYSLLVAVFYYFSHNILFSGVAVSILAGAFSVIAIYYIACELFSPRVAALAGLLATMNPTLVVVSTYCLTDSLALCFLLFAYLFGLKIITTERYIYAIFSGVLFVLAFLTRQITEIHIYSFLLLFTLIMIYRKKTLSLLKFVGILVVSILLSLTPYMYFTYTKTGHVVINTGKDYFGVKKAVLQHKINDGFYDKIEKRYRNMTEPFKSQVNSEIEYRALNDKNDRLLSFDYYYKVIEPQKKDNAGLSIIRKENLRKVLFNAYDLCALLWHSYGLLALFFLVGLYLCILNGQFFALFALFAIGADIMLILLEHHEDRYAINILAFISIFAAYGLTMSIYYGTKNIKSAMSVDKINNVILLMLLILSLVWNIKIYSENINRIKAENNKLTTITDSIAKYIKPGYSIAAHYPTYVFPLKGEYIPLPIAEYENTLEYLKKRKADYLIMSPDAVKLRPFLSIPKLNQDREFSLLKEITINNENWYLYKKILSPEYTKTDKTRPVNQ
jgi:4-amino-4-deoxy-L-arabinose transferase-like glycosyltransferase